MFKQTQQRLYKVIGKVKLADLPIKWQFPVDTTLLNEEQANPDFTFAEIRGSLPHLSHDDPTDAEEVVSVRLKNGENKTIQWIRIHQDGSVRKVI
ncbi:uncharacterized protein N7477_002930 [Penicillium maclennaniae]|uniref:uncharacterized protein n=1 Tax=Penicillium maclennaniae TaxID=1343394 RepID=UPI002541F0E2|nr:uncharacterized protein N7477_002930 [Penicillium maclennaniae]KAJ5677297.1 hypothetical protein N7477_002930 [Penicillium maclennaniae]